MAGRAWGREAQLRVGLEHGRIEALTGKDAQDTSDEVGGAEGGRQSLGPDAIAGADGGRCDEAAHTWAGEAAAAAAAARLRARPLPSPLLLLLVAIATRPLRNVTLVHAAQEGEYAVAALRRRIARVKRPWNQQCC